MSRKKNYQHIHIPLGIFDSETDVWIGGMDALVAFYKSIRKNRYNGPDLDPDDYEYTRGKSYGGDIWLKSVSFNPKDMEALAHEVCHQVTDLCVDREINDEETRAYLTGYITGMIFKKAKMEESNGA